jgi:FtsH-binding integral membrane protein
MKRRRSRVGIGILLLVVGVTSVANSGENPPVGAVQTATYYVISFALFAGGLWLIFRKGSRPTDASTAAGTKDSD